MIAKNLRSPFILIREAFWDMKRLGGGRMIMVISTICKYNFETMSVYSAAKEGLEGIVDIFRKEARPFNVRVTSVYPGGTDSNFRKNRRPDYLRPESVASLLLPDELLMDEKIFRPMAETNMKASRSAVRCNGRL